MYVVYQREEPLFVLFLIEKEQRRLCLNRVSLRSECFRAVSEQRTRGELQMPREKWRK